MSSSNHYDQNLLGSAQAPTKSQLQEGYNVDLLDEGRPVRSSSGTPKSTARDVEAGAAGAGREKPVYTGAAAKQPSFFGSTKGRIIILVAALVIIGAVVGGAVGGTVHHNNNKASPTTSSSAAAPTSQGAGGDGNGTTTSGGNGVGTDFGAAGPAATSTHKTEVFGASTTQAAGSDSRRRRLR